MHPPSSKMFRVYAPVLFGERRVEMEARSVNELVDRLGPLLEYALEVGCEPVIEVEEVGLKSSGDC